MPNLEADGKITIYEIATGNVVHQYEGMDVVRVILDKNAEIARLTSEVSELRRLGDAMAEQIGLNRYVQNKINKGADANGFIFFSEDDAAALDGWERAAKSREQTA